MSRERPRGGGRWRADPSSTSTCRRLALRFERPRPSAHRPHRDERARPAARALHRQGLGAAALGGGGGGAPPLPDVPPARLRPEYSSLGSMFVAIAMRLVKLYIEATSATSQASSSDNPLSRRLWMSVSVSDCGCRVSFSA